MGKLFLGILLLASMILLSCSKENSPAEEKEEKLIIALDPDPGGSFVRSLSTTYPFTLVVKSKLPAKGVDVLVNFRKELDNALVFSQQLQGFTPQLSLSVNDIPFNEMGIVTVEVKSKSDPSNLATTSFRLIKK